MPAMCSYTVTMSRCTEHNHQWTSCPALSKSVYVITKNVLVDLSDNIKVKLRVQIK